MISDVFDSVKFSPVAQNSLLKVNHAHATAAVLESMLFRPAEEKLTLTMPMLLDGFIFNGNNPTALNAVIDLINKHKFAIGIYYPAGSRPIIRTISDYLDIIMLNPQRNYVYSAMPHINKGLEMGDDEIAYNIGNVRDFLVGRSQTDELMGTADWVKELVRFRDAVIRLEEAIRRSSDVYDIRPFSAPRFSDFVRNSFANINIYRLYGLFGLSGNPLNREIVERLTQFETRSDFSIGFTQEYAEKLEPEVFQQIISIMDALYNKYFMMAFTNMDIHVPTRVNTLQRPLIEQLLSGGDVRSISYENSERITRLDQTVNYITFNDGFQFYDEILGYYNEITHGQTTLQGKQSWREALRQFYRHNPPIGLEFDDKGNLVCGEFHLPDSMSFDFDTKELARSQAVETMMDMDILLSEDSFEG